MGTPRWITWDGYRGLCFVWTHKPRYNKCFEHWVLPRHYRGAASALIDGFTGQGGPKAIRRIRLDNPE